MKTLKLTLVLLLWGCLVQWSYGQPDTLWTQTYGGMDREIGHSVYHTTDGGYIIAGMTESLGAGSADVYLLKTDANGDTLWTKTFGGSDYDYGYAVQQTTDGGFIVVGETESFGEGSYNVYLIRTDENGDTLWTKTYGGSGYEYGKSVLQTHDEGFIITGTTNSFGEGSGDVYLIRTNENGDTRSCEGLQDTPWKAKGRTCLGDPSWVSSLGIQLTQGN